MFKYIRENCEIEVEKYVRYAGVIVCDDRLKF